VAYNRYNQLLVFHPRERFWLKRKIDRGEPLYGSAFRSVAQYEHARPEDGKWQAKEVATPPDATAQAYKLLGLDNKATEADAKAAFKRLAFEHHPDRGGDVAKFHEAKAALDRVLLAIKSKA
jgi:DnaJ-domain-containing protein 1